MAEEAIENELNCTICLDTYTDPKILQCFHVFCRKCLVKLVLQDQQRQLTLPCPICRHVTPVPARGTASLPSAFRVNRLLEILDQHKKAPASSERMDGDLPAVLYCFEHDGRALELFCETCGELICFKCAIKGGKHHGHNYEDVGESFERYKEEVRPSLEMLEKKMATITKVLTQLDRHCVEITTQRATIEAEIRESTKRLHDVIRNRQDQLISQLDQITTKKLNSLATQRDQIETLQAQLSSCLEFTRESLNTGDSQQHEVLVMKTDILVQVRELATSSQTDVFNISTEADIMFLGSLDAAAVCEGHGRVCERSSPDPLKCAVTGKGAEEAVVGEKATAVLEAINFAHKECCENVVSKCFEVELVSDITGDKVRGVVERRMTEGGQGQNLICYQPVVKGKHRLHIKADVQHIRGSPFSIAVTQPVEKLTSILALSDLGRPWGVAVTKTGEVVVTEYGANCVSLFRPSGEKLQSFISIKEPLMGPSGVAADRDGNLLVLDWGKHQIHKFAADCTFLGAFGIEGSGPLEFRDPVGITYNAESNRIYVADTYNHRIQVLTSDLRFISMFGKEGSGKGQFKYPSGVATDSTGRVYVADSSNHRIQIFTAEGKFLRKFGKEGASRGELGWPWGVGVDARGLVYVSENENHRVSVFTSEGKFVLAFGSEGTGPGGFNSPCGVAVDDCGVVYVCDSKHVKLF